MITVQIPETQAKRRIQQRKHLEYIPGQMIIRIKRQALTPRFSMDPPQPKRASSRLDDELAAVLRYLKENAGLKTIAPIVPIRNPSVGSFTASRTERAELASVAAFTTGGEVDLSGISVLILDPKKATPALAKRLRGSRAIEIAELMPARWCAGLRGGAPSLVGDPLQNLQWGLRAIRWFHAQTAALSPAPVGILDTGIDVHHPDLRNANISYYHGGLRATDLLGHGTHVAGIIAAQNNDDAGIIGVARCPLAVWKIFPDEPEHDGRFYVDGQRYLQALVALVGAGVKVVNLSLGGTASSETEALLFRRLASRGIVTVAAMGNEYEEGNPTEYPAAYEGVLAVGAVAENRRRSSFSSTGKHIALVAPGSNILSTLPTRRSVYLKETLYGSWSGTSMAAPYVAGAAALVSSRFPKDDFPSLKDRLTGTATALPGMRSKRRTRDYGFGLLNLQKALS